MNESDIQQMIERLKRLYQRRRQILAEGNIAPAGAWIHEYEVVRHYPSGTVATYEYAKWQATEPIFKRNPKKRGRPLRQGKDPELSCHQHIGRVASTTGLGTEPEVKEAYKEWNNRKQLEAIDKALNEIQGILDSVLGRAEG